MKQPSPFNQSGDDENEMNVDDAERQKHQTTPLRTADEFFDFNQFDTDPLDFEGYIKLLPPVNHPGADENAMSAGGPPTPTGPFNFVGYFENFADQLFQTYQPGADE